MNYLLFLLFLLFFEFFKDYRYQRKDECFNKENFNSDVLEMDIRLGGTYSFYETRKFAYGSTGEFKGSSGEDGPIQFAIVGENQPVGILELWKHYDNSMFVILHNSFHLF